MNKNEDSKPAEKRSRSSEAQSQLDAAMQSLTEHSLAEGAKERAKAAEQTKAPK